VQKLDREAESVPKPPAEAICESSLQRCGLISALTANASPRTTRERRETMMKNINVGF
jgi:hypothetical protein